MRFLLVCCCLVLGSRAECAAAENPRRIDPGPSNAEVRFLSQNWDHAESNWFYNVPQGSRLLPYHWFLHLEQADSAKRFRANENLRKFGYIPRTADPENPDALPVGFIKDADWDPATPGLGMTCAACHTGQISRQGKLVIIDGAPAMADMERFQKALVDSLAATAAQPEKLARFARAVSPAPPTADEVRSLREALLAVAAERRGYNERNLPRQPSERFGAGRVDAFGAIFNEVTVTFLNQPGNWSAANAPVSYPSLWDAPQHDRVQWNGAAENKVNPLGQVLFGTPEVGALGRNAGEVLGVFGHAAVRPSELVVPWHYDSTVRKPNLMQIEDSLKTLWSPEWPVEVLGPIDPDLKEAGSHVYKRVCADCHSATLDRTSPTRKVQAFITDVGTDPQLNQNFARTVETGVLRGRRKTLLGLERFGTRDTAPAVLKHVVERTILSPQLSATELGRVLVRARDAQSPLELIDALNPGFQMTATIRVGDKVLTGQFERLQRLEEAIEVKGGKFTLKESPDAAAGESVDLRNAEAARQEAERHPELLTLPAATTEAPQQEGAVVQIRGQQIGIGYKARPLNGVWATAPYLHNGSVPNLVELLKPPAGRDKTFHVGSIEFDPERVGFVDDPSFPEFDVNIVGNSNAGHDFGTDLSDEEKRQLIEYLKSL